jgi:hypothetical protein
VLSPDDTKKGGSTRPIGQPAFEILATLPRVAACPYVLLAACGGGLPHGFRRIAKRAGVTGVTAHTLRHSFASTAGDLGYSEPPIAAMLRQAAGSVTGRYIHHLDTVLVDAANRVAARIPAAMTGDAGQDDAGAELMAEMSDAELALWADGDEFEKWLSVLLPFDVNSRIARPRQTVGHRCTPEISSRSRPRPRRGHASRFAAMPPRRPAAMSRSTKR